MQTRFRSTVRRFTYSFSHGTYVYCRMRCYQVRSRCAERRGWQSPLIVKRPDLNSCFDRANWAIKKDGPLQTHRACTSALRSRYTSEVDETILRTVRTAPTCG